MFIVLLSAAAMGLYVITSWRPTVTSESSMISNASVSTITSQSPPKVNLIYAAYYLASNYNSGIELASETANSNVFYLYSDNYLVQQALKSINPPDTTLRSVMNNISRTIASYSRGIGDSMNQYMVIGDNWNGSCVFNDVHTYSIATLDDDQILADINNGTDRLLDSNYADIAFLSAICYHNEGNQTQALSEFNIGKALFNGTGFIDEAFNDPSSQSYHKFQTYKLAQFLYASRLLSQPIDSATFNIILGMQAPDGGFYTSYDASLKPLNVGSPKAENVETTSLAILALVGLALR